ncbi:POM121 and ZP3 fusion protein-like [Sinocyclocheilus rhinocerous]|uniref:POM121 and ZP3 fusion protein-like n=1 Tax=Sinocyclocheilus rhinocerous TaxID=307959 RepID=UPI0007B8D6F2|nr:PREDICTED: POM121 and ZP3 fusion protein-like [Sinocyclocheilus rhinocerous]
MNLTSLPYCFGFVTSYRCLLQIYITCIVKATLASAPSDALRKSCSFSNGWLAADGNHQACGCCDSTCGPDGGNAAPFGGVQWEGNASLGPVMVQERPKTSAGFQ